MLELLLRPAVLGPAVLLLSYVLYQAFFTSSNLPKLPIIGAKKGDIFPTFQAQWRNIVDWKKAVMEAYDKHKDEAVLMPLFGQSSAVLLPVSETQWVVDQPDEVLSLHENAIQSLQIDLTVSDPQLIHVCIIFPR